MANTDCTLTISGVVPTLDVLRTVLSAVTFGGGSWAHVVDMPSPNESCTNSFVFNSRREGTIDSTLVRTLVHHRLSFAWVLEPHANLARTAMVSTPTHGIFTLPLDFEGRTSCTLDDASSPSRIARLRNRDAVLRAIIDRGQLIYAPSAHGRLAAQAHLPS